MLPCGLVLSGTRADIHLRFTLSWRQRRTSGLEEVFPCSARTASDMCSPTISGEGVPACSADSNNLTLRRRPLSAQWPHRTKLDGTGLPGPAGTRGTAGGAAIGARAGQTTLSTLKDPQQSPTPVTAAMRLCGSLEPRETGGGAWRWATANAELGVPTTNCALDY